MTRKAPMTIIIGCAVSAYMTAVKPLQYKPNASYLLRPMTRKAPMTIIIDCAVSVNQIQATYLDP